MLTLLILAPAGLLFYRVWQDNEDNRDSTQREQQGVEYLTSLSPLVSALAEAQSSALQGVSAPPASLTTAVARVAAVDQRLGDTLGTRERWTGLRDKIGALGSAGGSPVEVFQAHVEVSELALALFNTVRTSSDLNQDPDNDISNLQQALSADLPTAVVQVSRMGDLSLMVANISGSAQQRAQAQAILGPQFGAAVQAVNGSVGSLTDHLQAAVDDTSSTTLSGNLVTTLDAFRRGVESFIKGASTTPPRADAMATAQSQLQTSLNSLAGVLVRETNGLLDARLDDIDTRRLEALVAAGAAVLFALLAIIVQLTGRRGRRPMIAPPVPGAEGRGYPAGPDPFGTSQLDPGPQFGPDSNPTRRERSGALR